jgi:DNA repair protein RadC
MEISKMAKGTLRKKLRYMIPQYRLVLVKEGRDPLYKIESPEDMAPLIEPMRHLAEEQFIVFHMNCNMNPTGFQIVSHGTATSSLVHPREVFKAALLTNAASIVVAHNHPSDSPNPSRDDIKTTRQLIRAGRLLGIAVTDHLIVTSKQIVSIREQCPLATTATMNELIAHSGGLFY